MLIITLHGRFVARARDRSEALKLIAEHKQNRAANRDRLSHLIPAQKADDPKDKYELLAC